MKITTAHIEKAITMARAAGASRLILFGSAYERPDRARDLDLACDGVEGWKIFELGARLEAELKIPVDLVPLSPPSRFTRYIESYGKALF